MKAIDREILRLAVPSIVSNITVPLLGLVDLGIAGHMASTVDMQEGGGEAYISAISVGSMIFNIIYWLMGFLRMGTSGMTSQAYGARDITGIRSLLRNSLTMSLCIAAAFLVLQMPLLWVALAIIHPSADVRPLVTNYFNIVIWGAPAMLSLYSLNGWFIGTQNTRTPMMVAIFQNIVNIIASLTFVYGFGMRIEGIALGTLVAQWSGVVMAVGKPLPSPPRRGGNGPLPNPPLQGGNERKVNTITIIIYGFNGRNGGSGAASPLPEGEGLGVRSQSLASLWSRSFSINRDIFLRTVCLVAVNLAFTSAGARQGNMMLAVNTLLMTFYTLFSYIMDGFAYAGEALTGKYYGAKDERGLKEVIRRLLRHWGLSLALLFTLLYIIGGPLLLHVLTDDAAVIAAAHDFLPWACLIPLAGFAAFVYDGIYIGLTATRGMLISSFVSSLTFFAILFAAMLSPLPTTHPLLVNHALWLAFIAYLAMRGVMQKRILARNSPQSALRA